MKLSHPLEFAVFKRFFYFGFSLEHLSNEPKVRGFIKTYKSLRVEKCRNCGKVICMHPLSMSLRLSV